MDRVDWLGAERQEQAMKWFCSVLFGRSGWKRQFGEHSNEGRRFQGRKPLFSSSNSAIKWLSEQAQGRGLWTAPAGPVERGAAGLSKGAQLMAGGRLQPHSRTPFPRMVCKDTDKRAPQVPP